jgi:HAD superfamily hydrolase (TIGR01509 family)
MLELGRDALPVLDQLLFATPSRDAGDIAAGIAERFAVDPARAVAACAGLWNAQIEEAYAIPGALELIAALRASGIQRAYLSNIWPPFYSFFARTFASEKDAPQFLSFRTGVMKPNREFYLHALRCLGAAPKEVVMVGDTYTNDILPAIELGMRTVWLLHRPDKETASLVRVLNRETPAPDLTLASISELEPCTFTNLNSSPKASS